MLVATAAAIGQIMQVSTAIRMGILRVSLLSMDILEIVSRQQGILIARMPRKVTTLWTIFAGLNEWRNEGEESQT